MSLQPELKKIKVDVSKLLLDPNNPRLFSREEARVPLDKVMDPGVQDSTLKRLFPKNDRDRFKIDELVQSIRINAYVPEAGGYIFVRGLEETDYYLVLEGNRRLVALRELLADSESRAGTTPGVLASIRSIDVLEIIDDIPEERLQEKISYLLGTCHHGSHKTWSPFARAKGIYERYLNASGQDDQRFRYDKRWGEEVASLLSIEEKEVAERLQVYRTMSQLAQEPRMQEKRKGGIIDRYYSLILGAIKTSSQGLRVYIPRDPNSLQLMPEAIDRMISLCNFDGTRDRKSGRESTGGIDHPPAMINPGQWKFLGKILDDEQEEPRAANLESIEVHHQSPEEVWARRHATLTKLTWPKWLEQVVGILHPVQLGTEFDDDPGAKRCIEELETLTTQLTTCREADSGGPDET